MFLSDSPIFGIKINKSCRSVDILMIRIAVPSIATYGVTMVTSNIREDSSRPILPPTKCG